jgi:predicted lipoprotein with Yx(FWY)xxD motif
MWVAPLWLLAAALVAGCGGASPSAAPAHRTGPRASVRVERTRLGRILVDSRGRTLYLFTEDRHGHSRCYAACARIWRPAVVTGRPVAGSALAAKLTRVRRRDGAWQLVYNRHPLYTLVADSRPGQINGQGNSGTWFVVSPAGHRIGRGKAASGY